MRTALRKIGNSAGVVIPSALIGEAGLTLGSEIEVSVEGKRVVLTPLGHDRRAGWAEAAAAIGREEDPELEDWLNVPYEQDEELEW